MLRDADLPGRALTIAFALTLLVLWLVLPPYPGITHDGQGYTLQALARLDPAVASGDITDSQAGGIVFSADLVADVQLGCVIAEEDLGAGKAAPSDAWLARKTRVYLYDCGDVRAPRTQTP